MFHIPAYAWGLGAVALTAVSMFPYIIVTVRGANRPHLFTWIIWTLVTGIAFAVQYIGGAGPGAWATGFTFLCTGMIMLVSIRYGEKNITRLDWIAFTAALAAIPLWLITKNAALAAVWVTAIDGLGYIPTGFKAWRKPREEMVFAHAVANVKHLFSLMGMSVFSIATVFYPLSLLIFNAALVGVILCRRRSA